MKFKVGDFVEVKKVDGILCCKTKDLGIIIRIQSPYPYVVRLFADRPDSHGQTHNIFYLAAANLKHGDPNKLTPLERAIYDIKT